ncbi:hypothetical protein LCGC14_2660090, partial [marine sediment metagenome]
GFPPFGTDKPVDVWTNLQIMGMPAVIGGLGTGAIIMRFLRSQMLEVLLEEQRAEIHRYDEIDRMLVGRAGALPPELRRALLGIGNRRLLRLIFYKPLILMYRFVYLLRNRRSARKQFGSAAEES